MKHNLLTNRGALVALCAPLTITLLTPAAPLAAAHAGAGLILAANEDEGTLSILDPARGTQIAKVDVEGYAGHEVTASPDGRFAFVPIYGDSNAGMPGSDGRDIVKIDIPARKVVARFTFDTGVRPHAAVFNPADGLLYVTTELDRSIAILNPETMTLVGKIPTGQSLSHMMVISRDGRFGYVSNIEPGSVSILDLRARKQIDVVKVSAKAQRIALSIDDQSVFTADQKLPRLAVIDTATHKISKWIALPSPGMGITPTPDGRRLLVAMEATSQVAVVNLVAGTVERTIDLPQYPHAIVMSGDGSKAFVSCSLTNEVATIRTSDWTLGKIMKAGPFVDGLAWVSSTL